MPVNKVLLYTFNVILEGGGGGGGSECMVIKAVCLFMRNRKFKHDLKCRSADKIRIVILSKYLSKNFVVIYNCGPLQI